MIISPFKSTTQHPWFPVRAYLSSRRKIIDGRRGPFGDLPGEVTVTSSEPAVCWQKETLRGSEGQYCSGDGSCQVGVVRCGVPHRLMILVGAVDQVSAAWGQVMVSGRTPHRQGQLSIRYDKRHTRHGHCHFLDGRASMRCPLLTVIFATYAWGIMTGIRTEVRRSGRSVEFALFKQRTSCTMYKITPLRRPVGPGRPLDDEALFFFGPTPARRKFSPSTL